MEQVRAAGFHVSGCLGQLHAGGERLQLGANLRGRRAVVGHQAVQFAQQRLRLVVALYVGLHGTNNRRSLIIRAQVACLLCVGAAS